MKEENGMKNREIRQRCLWDVGMAFKNKWREKMWELIVECELRGHA